MEDIEVFAEDEIKGLIGYEKVQAERQITWHYDRVGTIEHVIRSLKSDFARGKLPCGTFGANAGIWIAAFFAN
ncbi:MAG: hypothetical protein JNK65_01515 [Deltaproteobacteria bacterium]|nr:hypothetical protein [Deltaproteobacteria bacterium]